MGTRQNGRIEWDDAKDVKKRIRSLSKNLSLDFVSTSRVFCFRSENAKANAYARIWGLSRVWQKALAEKPAYILEVISEKFDRLDDKRQDEVLIHELTHIPRNFSGSLLAHTRRGKRSFKDRLNSYLSLYFKKK